MCSKPERRDQTWISQKTYSKAFGENAATVAAKQGISVLSEVFRKATSFIQFLPVLRISSRKNPAVPELQKRSSNPIKIPPLLQEYRGLAFHAEKSRLIASHHSSS